MLLVRVVPILFYGRIGIVVFNEGTLTVLLSAHRCARL